MAYDQIPDFNISKMCMPFKSDHFINVNIIQKWIQLINANFFWIPKDLNPTNFWMCTISNLNYLHRSTYKYEKNINMTTQKTLTIYGIWSNSKFEYFKMLNAFRIWTINERKKIKYDKYININSKINACYLWRTIKFQIWIYQKNLNAFQIWSFNKRKHNSKMNTTYKCKLFSEFL